MDRVLYVTHRQKQCGVYQFGDRVFNLLSRSNKVDAIKLEALSQDEYIWALKHYQPRHVLYNWYPVTMPWLTENYITDNRRVVHSFIFHDGFTRQNYDRYLFFGAMGRDINMPENKTVILPRPLFDYKNKFKKNKVLTIGSFGFGGEQKGFQELVRKVNREFEEAVLNIHMPNAFFGDSTGKYTNKIIEDCISLNTNHGIELNITTEFLSNEKMLDFLAKNSINVFLYTAVNQGLSSVLDYALSVQRPIAITNNMMFKHVAKDEILVENHSIAEIYKKGTAPLEEFYEKWSTDKFVEQIEVLFQ